MHDPRSDFHRLYMANVSIRKVAEHFGLNPEEIGRALHYAHISKTMKLANEQARARKETEAARQRALLGEQFRPDTIPEAMRLWCLQCDQLVTKGQATACSSKFCKAKDMAA